MNNKGFTLVELLAVIVILAIILAIAVPGISSLIESSKISTFEQSTRMIIKGIDINRKADSSFDVDGLNADNIDEALGIDNNNYKLLRAAATNDEVYVDIVGKNQWEGLEYYGTLDNLTLIKKGTYTLAPESCFTFNSATKTITKYNLSDPSCPKNPEIPDTIGGVTVEHIGPGSFITPLEHWCDADQKSLNYVHTESDGYDYCYYELNWESPGPITAVKLPRSTKTIGYGAFLFNQIENVYIPNGVTTIEDNSFEYSLIERLVIPNNVTTIGECAFAFNYLTSLDIPEGVKKISSSAFMANRLVSVNISSTVEEMGTNVLERNSDLVTLKVDNNNPYYKSVNNGMYTKDGTILLSGTKVMSNNIENTVTTIRGSAFDGMGLDSVTIPSSVTTIGAFAFMSNNITNLIIPDGVINIGSYAFMMNKLESVVISSSVATIGAGSFSSNFLTSIAINGNGVTIGDHLLAYNNNNFRTRYLSDGLGTYTGSQTGTWAKQP